MKRVLFGIVILVTIFLSGCNDKVNPVGFHQSGILPEEITLTPVLDSLGIQRVFSYSDSCRAYGAGPKLVFGNYQGHRTRVLVKVTDFSTYDGVDPIIPGSVKLHLRRHADQEDTLDNCLPNVAIPAENWEEDYATWFERNEDVLWTDIEHTMTPLDTATPYWQSDSLFVPLPDSLPVFWFNQPEMNYGAVLYNDVADQLIQIVSSESSPVPTLKFDVVSDGDTVSYSLPFFEDCFIYEPVDEPGVIHQTPTIASVNPTRLVIGFDLTPENLSAMMGISDPADLDFITVNKAVIEFQVDLGASMMEAQSIQLRSYLITNDETTYPVDSSDITFIGYPSYMTDYTLYKRDVEVVRVDATPLVQQILSGGEDNHDFLIKALYENRDFSRIVMRTDQTPKLKIMYTVNGLHD